MTRTRIIRTRSGPTRRSETAAAPAGPPPPAAPPQGLWWMPAAVGGRLAAMVKSGGWASVAAYVGLCAYCYALSERDTIANYVGVPPGMLALDLHAAILPACLITALAVIAYGLLLGVGLLVVGARSARRTTADVRGYLARITRRFERDRRTLLAKAPVFGRAVHTSMPVMFAILAVISGPVLALGAGGYFGHREARSGTPLNVLSDPALCPPRPASLAGAQLLCVIVARGGGQIVTRWIDDATGRLSPASFTGAGPAGGYVSTTRWFPLVLPVSPPSSP